LKKTAIPTHWISALFKKFQARYGSKWVSAIDGIEELAVTEWAEALSGLTGGDIKRGLDAWDGEWPPSAMEFLRACKPKNDWRLQAGAMRESMKALPEPKERRDRRRKRGKKAIEELKQAMGKPTTNTVES
jgi:hypothetical protein